MGWMRRTGVGLLAVGLCACAPVGESERDGAADAGVERTALGGRLFDMWYDEIDRVFVPDDPETPVVDGRGGPNGDGTLNGADGRPFANTGHDYRLKNLFGWDMRGVAGVYGRGYQDKPWILATGPLSPRHAGETRDRWIARLAEGDMALGLPAYGDVLSAPEIAALVDFMLAVRDGDLPHPDALYALSTEAPKGFVLAPGGDAERGRRFYAAQCADCHGADATRIIFDNGEQSLGQHARYYGYAVAMIVLAGEPGSDMGPQLPAGLDAAGQTATLLDLLAALCDRGRYPRGAGTDPEVPDNDPRCREYLR